MFLHILFVLSNSYMYLLKVDEENSLDIELYSRLVPPKTCRYIYLDVRHCEWEY